LDIGDIEVYGKSLYLFFLILLGVNGAVIGGGLVGILSKENREDKD
jgi:hypothetical protein